MDIRPPKPPKQPVNSPNAEFKIPGKPEPGDQVDSTPNEPPEADSQLDGPQESSKPSKKKLLLGVAGGLAAVVLLVVMWGVVQVAPRDPDGHGRRVNIESGLSNREIASHLQDSGIIRSAAVFDLYLRFSGSSNQLQAGTYVLSPSQTLPEVVSYLVEGRVDALTVTILPGLTIDELADHLAESYGYDKSELEEALQASYDHPLLASKPRNASLEGYIFPETYEVGGDSSVAALFEMAFDVMWARIQEDRLDRAVKSRGFTLHEAFTLASVIEREANPDEKESKQVSQVFQKRLKIDMPLGADATFVYAAKQLGVPPRVDIDSPYNTRMHRGLPPGPISNFNLLALEAVAYPAKGDYLYFLHDDDGKIYYAFTEDEHNENIVRYCGERCELN